jgi:hypothetical protein
MPGRVKGSKNRKTLERERAKKLASVRAELAKNAPGPIIDLEAIWEPRGSKARLDVNGITDHRAAPCSRKPPADRLAWRRGPMMLVRLPKEISNQIVERTDGVPLFIEELTKSVVESTKSVVESDLVKDAGNRYVGAGPAAPLAIPTTLHASLLARLDRLAPSREVAQIGAALGRSFSHELISAVAGMPQQKLDGGLDQLASAELIFRRGVPPDAEYTFKHALVRQGVRTPRLDQPCPALA